MKLQIGIDGNTYEVEVEVAEDDSASASTNYGPETLVPPALPFRPVPAGHTPAKLPGDRAGDGKVCRSPVAGVVIRVDVRSGQRLQVNDLMIVLEAMKMETNVTAAVAGTVKSVSVAPGDAVKVNQIVVEFE